MGRTYAGILGPLSFVTVIARSIVDGRSAESALLTAALALFVFASIGYIVGSIAERAVMETIETQFRDHWQPSSTPDAAETKTTRSTAPNQAA